ncbi:hypothetical protein ACOCJ5_07935 [Knoellia sp. CPCC 206450]|uniref:hypothetical protein n=1 Tax=Knoellia tibetensis TaxID=3404798 RepID=UPI003B43C94B
MSLHDDETDPTGMRELLRGLPDPGPMPDDLVARIQSSLADLRAPDATTTEHGSLSAVSRGTSPDVGGAATRPSWWARTGPRLAVAAAVLLGGGAVASGQLGLLATSNDSASSSAGSAGGDSGASDSGGAAAPEFTTGATSARQAEPGPVVITMTDRSYTSSRLGSEVVQPTGGTPVRPLAAETPAVGPIGTEIGVRSCLVALGLPQETSARVDLALLDGQPAAVVVVTGQGGRTAYAVGRDCTIGNPSVLAGPIDLP